MKILFFQKTDDTENIKEINYNREIMNFTQSFVQVVKENTSFLWEKYGDVFLNSRKLLTQNLSDKYSNINPYNF